MEIKIKLPRLRCKKCGHVWSPRVTRVNKCPNCGKIDRWNNAFELVKKSEPVANKE